MLLRTLFINLIILSHLTYCQIQINLHLTELMSNNDHEDDHDDYNNNIQHDCLYIRVPYPKDYDDHQILSFCLSEFPSKFQIRPNHIDPIFTFDQLAQTNITCEQLYHWSAPIDLIEQYAFYLNNPKSLLGNQTFYNCTLPYFGPQCQYIFKDLNYSTLSLVNMIDEYYSLNRYEPMLFTCYQHLKCNRGPTPACLDWTEICDGKVDCLDGGLDEEHCWQLEFVDRCDQNHYQCSNGQCIPHTFKAEHRCSFDCSDQSDEIYINHYIISTITNIFRGPTFIFEDVSCTKFIEHNSGYLDTWTSSCVQNRQELYSRAMFSIKSNSLSDECWTAFKCLVHIPILNSPICKLICQNEFCDKLLKTKCPQFLDLSAIPLLFGHVNLVFNKNDLTYNQYYFRPIIKYICFDDQRLHVSNRYFNISSFNNRTCFNVEYLMFTGHIDNYHWVKIYICELHKWLNENSVTIDNNITNYTNSNVYKCENWPKYIPKRRLNDYIYDCLHKDDERSYSTTLFNCSTNQNENNFQCPNGDCILKDYFNDGLCDCSIDLHVKGCEDEDKTFLDLQYKSLFQQICDQRKDVPDPTLGPFTTYSLDEDNCEHWPLVHVYNHCDGYFDHDNGLDELNCDSSQPLTCPSNQHLCISQQTHQFICLSMNKIYDRVIDCVGAFDEPGICHKTLLHTDDYEFFCQNNNQRKCISGNSLCQSESFCMTNDYEQVCQLNDTYFPETSINSSSHPTNCTDFARFICKQYTHRKQKPTKIYFTLDQQMNFTDEQSENENTPDTLPQMTFRDPDYYHQRCHRGLDLEIYLDKERNLKTNVCLCPPSYYGSQCQYQNQRVSLTLKFRASTDSIQTPFRIQISLIDNTHERLIHSTQQITYISSKDCKKKYHFYLLYSTRPKHPTKDYFIHIDIYEKLTLQYRASLIHRIQYSFLPVYRFSYLFDIPPQNDSIESCLNKQCYHGKCIRYANDLFGNQSFCQCSRGWTGETCSIKYDCQCSSDALCLGQLANNRSLCICPLHRKGPKCFIEDKICQNRTCSQNGQCVSYDEYDKRIVCICNAEYSDDAFCQFKQTKLILSFDENIHLPSTIFIHFIEIKHQTAPYRSTTVKTIYPGQYSTIIRWSLPFHLVFIQFDEQTFYLALMQKIYRKSSTIDTKVQSSDRCLHIKDLFNETIVNSRLIERIKYYHLPCQKQTKPELKCFYDNLQLCLCQQVINRRVSNCFEFDHKNKSICEGRNACKNGGICYRENSDCSRISICQCPICFHGMNCELTTNSFNLSLDAILAFVISPNLSLSDQPSTILVCLCITIILIFFGSINAVFSLITFKNASTRQSGCGIYLLCSSILSFWILFFFFCKLLIVLLSQIGTITNYLFLNIQCYSLDFLLRCCLNIEQWLTAFVALERAIISTKGISFRQKKTKFYAKLIIISFFLFTFISNIHDPLYRRLFQENNDEQQRYWCIVEYSSTFLLIYNSFITIFHFILPFIINFISAIIIIVMKTKQQIVIQQKKHQQKSHLRKIIVTQIHQHQHILIAPCVLTILGIPRLIMSFRSSCMISRNDFWFYLIGYYISITPSLLTFIIFVLPSSTYKQAFRTAMSRFF